jgi:Mrp family chromosome partitioning ATPase
MRNFLKGSVFSRGGNNEGEHISDKGGGVLAVWGSPGAGKTVTAVKIAKYLAEKKKKTALLLCDMTAPMLPCICPTSELENERSLGSILAATTVTESLVKLNCVLHKRLDFLTIVGMLKGENAAVQRKTG